MVTVDFDPDEIYLEIQRSTDVGALEVAEKIVEDTNPLVPKSTGQLANSVTIEEATRGSKHADGNIQISYSRELNGEQIADSVYMGINPVTGNPIRHWTTPGTGPYWFEESKSRNLDSWIDYFAMRTREIWKIRGQRKRSKK